MNESVCAEGYGPGGCALLVTALGPDPGLPEAVRGLLHRHGGRAGAGNSVAYLFHPVGLLRFQGVRALAARALDAGAEDVRELPGGDIEVVTDPSDLDRVAEVLARRGHRSRSAIVTFRAAVPVVLDAGQASRLAPLLAELRALRGVSQVYTNAEIPEQLLAPL